jgi:hypothetical protein
MKPVLSLLFLVGAASALPAQGRQFPPGSSLGAKIGIPAPNSAPDHAKRAGMAYAHVASGDCSVKGVSCKERDIERGILAKLWAKVNSGGGK